MTSATIKDTNFNMRMNKAKKLELETLFSRLGMTLPDAVNIFFEQALLKNGLPFSVRLPKYELSDSLKAAIEEAEAIKTGKVKTKIYSSARELFDELDKEIEEENNAKS